MSNNWSDLSMQEILNLDFECIDNCPRDCQWAELIKYLAIKIQKMEEKTNA